MALTDDPRPESENGADGPQPPDEPPATPLLCPVEGVPELSIRAEQIADAAQRLSAGHGPFAVDAERASGFRYSNRAYLIQIRRSGAGTVLIDPVNHGGSPLDVLKPVAEVLASDEWILHAADQDLACLAEVGLRPPALFDTELAGRLAGLERVNLAAMVHKLLGLGLAKGHGAADWSKRPLPDAWLNYAALDVEVLIELRAAIHSILSDQGKIDWATEEFEYLRCAESTVTRRDRWRRTSGLHKVRTQEGLAAVREIWTLRDRIARSRDIAPGRILPDTAIVAAALADPKTVEELTALPVFGGSKQRRTAKVWLEALAAARATDDPPEINEPLTGPPPPVRWSKRKPEAVVFLEAARTALGELSAQVAVPAENLLSPDLVRRLCWDWQPVPDADAAVEEFLRDAGARIWQRRLVVPAMARALGSV